MSALYNEARELMNSISDVYAAVSVLGWDQEVLMPAGASSERAALIAGLDKVGHNLLTGTQARGMVERIRTEFDTLHEDERQVLKVFLRDHDIALKLPADFVEKMSHCQAAALDDWKKARAEKNFALFAPRLQEIVDLKIQAAEYYGYEEDRLDPLMDYYEPGLTVAQVKPVFERLRAGVQRLLAEVETRAGKPDDSALFKHFDSDKQIQFARSIVKELGFEFNSGRLDLSTHPFCSTFTPNDVRLTTRINNDDVRTCLFSVIHEGGHGMYEQGVDSRYFRTSAEHGTSMAIHESQSLFWEDIIARSREFWQWAFPRMQAVFPTELEGMDADDMFRAVNMIKPGFIRIDADELTYHMHIILRFEIEHALINKTLRVQDIPEAWNSKMQENLGITPPDDALGCLQDIHWSFGGIGYFPTYSLGKLYAAMMWKQLQAEQPGIRTAIAAGNFGTVREWLRENVHRFGRTRNSDEIIRGICGRSLSEQDYLEYMQVKIDQVYTN